MREGRAYQFALVDQFHCVRMDVDVAALDPGSVAVVESPRRLQREQSYGYLQALWWMWWEDGRSAVSVPPGAGEAVREIVAGVRSSEQLHDPDLADQLTLPVNAVLRRAGLKEVDRVLEDLVFACHRSLLRGHCDGDCRRLVDESIPAEGERLPTHCFPDGIVYGVVVDGRAVCVAFAHRTGVMEDLVADLGVGTAPAHRRRGYARTCVSAVVEHIAGGGGEARYGCSPDNAASAATARSVGFVPYGRSLILSAPAPEL